MRGWNDLPKETKQEVIKKLDFMSRVSMRSTCRLDRDIVDATDLYIPRVRFSTRAYDCMLTIYTGIEQFLRIEMIQEPKGTVIYRSQNSYSRRDAIIKRVQTIQPHSLAYKLMKDLLIHPNVLFGVFEYEHGDCSLENQQHKTITMMRAIKYGKIRAKKLVTNCKTKSISDMMLMKNVMDLKVLQEIANDGIYTTSNGELTPRQIMDCTLLPDEEPSKNTRPGHFPCQNIIKIPYYESQICMEYYAGPTAAVMITNRFAGEDGFATVRYSTDYSDIWDYQNWPLEQLNEKVQVKRFDQENGHVHRFNKSPCGVWAHVVQKDQEHKFLDFFKNETCGLRWLCKTCTDPFEYWYYQNIARRVHQEPEWSLKFIMNNHDQDIVDTKSAENMKKMSKKYEEDEAKNPKIVLKETEKSWGFRKTTRTSKKAPVVFKPFDDYEDLMIHSKENGWLLYYEIHQKSLQLISSKWMYLPPEKMTDLDRHLAMSQLMSKLKMVSTED